MKTRIIAVALMTLLLGCSCALRPQQKLSLEELEGLLKSSPSKTVSAYFESVPRGTAPERYDNILIRGVITIPGLKIIVFTTSHKIVAGMSGSPVYVGNKLVGALAYQVNRLNFSDDSWGGISPISLMLEEAGSGHREAEAVSTFNYNGMLFEPIALGHQSISELPFDKMKQGGGFDPNLFSGNKFFITTGSAGNTPRTGKKPALKAGMPIVVDLVEWRDKKGKITTVGALGTITYIDENGRIFAFGHPFLDLRKVVYSFRTCEIIGTVFSQLSSFKLGGEKSEILGTINFDGTYGIYGFTSLEALERLHHFNLELKTEGGPLNEFDIRVADCVWTPLLVEFSFGLIGSTNGAPRNEENSTTQLEAKFKLEEHKPVILNELFASESLRIGFGTVYASSFNIATEKFLRIYNLLFENRYGLKISDVSVSANFAPGKSQILMLGAYKFPNKVVWGRNPTLEILFVSQDNSIALAKKIPVQINWDRIEKPVYTKNTPDTEKTPEKTIAGWVSISSAKTFFMNLSDSEKQTLAPEYFLGADDFLANLSRQLEATNQKIFVRVVLRSRSGLFDEEVAKTEDIMPKNMPENKPGWHVINGGLTKRKMTLKDDGRVTFYIDLPRMPDGYVVNQMMRESLSFEVVLEK